MISNYRRNVSRFVLVHSVKIQEELSQSMEKTVTKYNVPKESYIYRFMCHTAGVRVHRSTQLVNDWGFCWVYVYKYKNLLEQVWTDL